jgi:hypothetical protein
MVEDNVGVKDDIGMQIEAAQKEQLERELELFTKNLEQIEAEKANFAPQWEIDKELVEIILDKDNLQKVNPEFKYELNPRYWELRKKQIEYKFRMDKHLAESKLKGYDVQKTAVLEQIESSTQKLKELG